MATSTIVAPNRAIMSDTENNEIDSEKQVESEERDMEGKE